MIIPVIKHRGLGEHPHGINSILNSLYFSKPVVIYAFDPLITADIPYTEIASETNTVFVILYTGEGHGYTELKEITHKLNQVSNVDLKNIVYFTGCILDKKTPTGLIPNLSHAYVTLGLINSTLDQLKDSFISPRQHYICLNRLPRWERAAMVSELLDRKLDKFGSISFCAGVNQTENDVLEMQKMFDSKYHHRLPIVFDMPDLKMDGGFVISNMQSVAAMFNIVTESSYELLDENALHPPQQNPGLTEKTFKAFLIGQIPIMVAPLGTVSAMKKLGFDVFDDIVDHSYDTEIDPRHRITLIANEVERLCKYSTDELTTIQQRIMPRLGKNIEVLRAWAYDSSITIPYWIEYFRSRNVLR